MGIDLESHHVLARQRNAGSLSSKSSSSDLVNNNNGDKCSDRNEQSAYGFESDFDAHATTLDPHLTDQFTHIAENLSLDEAIHQLKEFGAKTPILPSQIGTDFNFKRKVVWKNTIGFLLLHICAVIGVVIAARGHAKGYTLLYCEYENFGSGNLISYCNSVRAIIRYVFSFLSAILAFALLYGCGLGVTAGAHRLWSHRAYKAKTPLRLFLLWLHTLAGQVN